MRTKPEATSCRCGVSGFDMISGKAQAMYAMPGPAPVGNSILLATDFESGDAAALCQRSVA
jgi:hypothetical protein